MAVLGFLALPLPALGEPAAVDQYVEQPPGGPGGETPPLDQIGPSGDTSGGGGGNDPGESDGGNDAGGTGIEDQPGSGVSTAPSAGETNSKVGSAFEASPGAAAGGTDLLGYEATPFVAYVIAFLAACLLIRLAVVALDRFRGGEEASSE